MNKKLSIKRASEYIKKDIWQIPLDNKPSNIAFLIKQLRVVIVAIRGFNEDKCMEKASSLTYYSLLSIVPVFAMMFGIAKGFGFEKKMEEHLYATLSDKKEILDQIFEFTHRMLENTQGGLIAGAGLVLLLWSIMKLLTNIEKSFNEIWEVARSRSAIRKISDYFSIMLLAPILIVVSKSATTLISDYIGVLQDKFTWMSYFGWAISAGLKLMPWSLVWFAFAFLYILMPNTKVYFRSAIVGGIIGGIIFQIVQYIYIKFQVGAANYNAIYGSFAALPLFLVWLQTSWLIVLLGAEISFASQNANKYEFELESNTISHNFRIKLSVYITHLIALRFEEEKPALTTSELADELGLPHRVLYTVVNQLIKSKVLIFTTTEDEKVNKIQIAIPLSHLSIYRVIEMINTEGTNELDIIHNSCYDNISDKIESLYNQINSSSDNLLLKDIK